MRFWPLRKPPATPVQVAVREGQGRSIPREVASRSALRRRATVHHPHGAGPKIGMWVFYARRCGILTWLNADDNATVMLTDEHGLNSLQVTVPARELRQAYLHEIPACRRPDERSAVDMGYLIR